MSRLTLDKAIEREKEVAERNRKDMEFIKEDNKKYDKSSNSIINYENRKANDDLIKCCIKNAEYYEQLAEWLEELKRRREYDGEIIGSGALNNAYDQGYNKAIDDFANELHSLEFDYAYGVSIVLEPKQVEVIAEQLKEGGAEE